MQGRHRCHPPLTFEQVQGYSWFAMASELSLTAIYEPVEDGWVQARIEELPEVITAAATADEAREMLVDALWEYIASLRHPENGRSPDAQRERLELTISAAGT
jgi:predicted RNase H-like HicB family nuclease